MECETKNERFVRIVEARTNKIVHTLRLLGNCANKNNYEYSEKEVDAIFKEIEMQLAKTKSIFEDALKPKQRFTLNIEV